MFGDGRCNFTVQTLTLIGALLVNKSGNTNTAVTVFDGDKPIDPTSFETKLVNGSMATVVTYTIAKDGAVTVVPTGDIADTTATYIVNGVAVTVDSTKNGNNGNITFKMEDDVTLNIATKDSFADAAGTAVPAVFAVTSHNGVAGTHTATTGGKVTELKAGETIYVTAGNLVLTSNGDGAVVIKGKQDATKTLGTTYFNANDGTAANKTVAISANTDLYAATSVVTVGTNVTAVNTADSVTVNGTASYVALEEVLTISKGSFDGAVVSDDTNVVHGESKDTYTVAGKKDVTIYGAFKVNIDDGVNAVYGTSDTALADGDFVNAAQTVKLTAKSADKVVVADRAGNGYGEQVAHSTSATVLAQGEEYVTYTKLSLAASVGKIQLPTDQFGNQREITVGAAKVYGFASGATINIVGTNAAKSMLVSAGSETNVKADAADASTKIVEIVSGVVGTAASAPSATVKVADRALSFAQET